MEWVIVLLLLPVVIAGLCLVDVRYRKKQLTTQDAPECVYIPTKADRYAEEHLEWDKQFGPPYFYNTIEAMHMNSLGDLIDEKEIIRRHKLGEYEHG